MSHVAAIVVVGFGFVLIAFTGVAYAKPAMAERFLSSFASSARTHYAEQVVRLLVGAALVILSPAMWQPKVFWVIGWAIFISSAVLICLPWQWHHRFGERLRPLVMGHLRWYAAGAFAFGVVLIFGTLGGG